LAAVVAAEMELLETFGPLSASSPPHGAATPGPELA
jgi:hypothetical protein